MQIWSIVYERPEGAPTGFGRAVWCLSKVFAKSGIQVSILYTSPEGSKGVVKEVVDKIHLYGVPARGRLISRRITFYKNAIRLIRTLADRSDFNVFILHSPFTLPLAKSLRSLGVVVYHTFGSLTVEFASSLRELLLTRDMNKLMRYMSDIPLEIVLTRNVDMVVVPHDKAAREFELGYGVSKEKIIVSPYGQDTYERFNNDEFFKEAENFRNRYNGKKLILFVGGVAWNRKGARHVIHAFHKFSRRVPSILIMTGKPTRECLVLARRFRLMTNKDILLPGLVDDRTLFLLYASCDVFALPSLHEGFSQPVIEVMAYGKPVVVSPIAAYPSVRDGVEGFIIDPHDTEGFAEAIGKVLVDDRLYSKMSSNARKKAQQFSWDEIGLGLLHRFNTLMYSNFMMNQPKMRQGFP